MKLFLKNCLLIIVISLGISSAASIGSLWSLRNSSFYKPSFLSNGVSEKKFNYIVLGASTGLTTLDTKLIDSVTGLKGLNLSMDDTAMASQFLMLQHFLAEGKRSNYCVLAPSVNTFNRLESELSDNDYRFLMFVNRPYVASHFAKFSGFESRILSTSRILPFVGVSYFNAEIFYPSLLAIVKPNYKNRFDDKGNYTYPMQTIGNTLINSKSRVSIKFSNPWLLKIKELCDQNQIQLICYLSPMAKESAIVNEANFQIINHSDLISHESQFYDDIHVNSLGREKASLKFSEDLILFK